MSAGWRDHELRRAVDLWCERGQLLPERFASNSPLLQHPLELRVTGARGFHLAQNRVGEVEGIQALFPSPNIKSCMTTWQESVSITGFNENTKKRYRSN